MLLETELINALGKQDLIDSTKYLTKIIKNSVWLKFLSKKSINYLSQQMKYKKYKEKEVIKIIQKPLNQLIYIVSGKIKKSTLKSIYSAKFQGSSSFSENSSKGGKGASKKILSKNLIRSSNSELELLCLHKAGTLLGENEMFTNCDQDYSLETDCDEEGNNCCEVILISQIAIMSCIGSLMLDFIKNNLFFPLIKKEKSTIDITQGKLLAYLGKGSYGKVNLLKLEDKIYAVKAISKHMILKKTVLVEYLMEEKKCLISASSPFIVSYKGSYKDDNYCYLIQEYIEGKEFREISEQQILKYRKDECIFYFANIVVMLEHLKSSNIIHRDLKTSNIILSTNGFLKLLDFGLSKVTKDYAYTVIGSPFYMAPEVILGKGYDKSCDFWSLGIIFFEIFYGTFPFGKNCYTTLEVYNQILNNDIIFPITGSDCGTYEINGMIRKLLHKSIRERATTLKECRDYFLRFDWDKLIDMTITPPIKLMKQVHQYYNDVDKTSSKDILNKLGINFTHDLMKKDNKINTEEIITHEDNCLFREF